MHDTHCIALFLFLNILSNMIHFVCDLLLLRTGGNRAVNPWDSGEPPSLQRKISQDDSMHDYDGGYNSKKSLKVRGGRWNGNTVDLDADSKEITANDRVGGLVSLLSLSVLLPPAVSSSSCIAV